MKKTEELVSSNIALQGEFDPVKFDKLFFIKNDVFAEADATYKLGDTFYITANGPAYVQLEQGLSDQAPDGIMKPALEVIKTAVESNLKYYYDEV